MDLLRRVDFTLVHHTSPPSAYLIINKCHLPVHFTDTQSLHVSLVSVPDVFTTELDASAAKCTATAGSLNTTIANKNVVSITSQGEPTVRCLADMSFQHETDILKTSTTQTGHTQEDQARTLPFDSRHVHVHRATSIPGKAAKFVRCKVSRDVTGDAVVLEAQSGPMFMVPNSVAKVTPQRECDVWVVNLSTRPLTLKNGKKLGNVYGVSEREVGTSDGGEAGSPLLVEESPGLPGISQVEESLVEPEEIEHPSFSEDEFDCAYGLYDFGYEDDHFTIFPDVDLSPSPACAVTPHSQTETTHSQTETVGDKSEVLSSHKLPDLDGLLTHLPSESRSKLKEVLHRYPLLFSGDKTSIGTVPGVQHTIITSETRPICTRQWPLPHATRQVIKAECDEMLEAGVIEPSTSPWLSPVVLVKKKDGSVRFCVDYRNLNSITTPDTYPLPRIDELIDDLNSTSVFTCLDARAAYWSVEVKPEDRPKTAFSDGHRLFQFKRLPFGLATAPSTFQRTMNVILSPVLGRHTLAYLDDIVIYSASFDLHLQHLDETLSLLCKAGLKLNLSKCNFVKDKIRFLGFEVSGEGVAPDPSKVTCIAEMNAPKNVKGVRRFLGATGFFRKHIDGYATLAAPLTRLLKKDAPFAWGQEQEAAFKSLKQKLITAPILRQPDFTREFEIHTDASQIAIGAALFQRDDVGVPHAIGYFSRKLRNAESRYPAIDLEALAVVEGVRVFDPYVYGRRFKIYTDHRPLTYVFKRKTKSPRLSRYAHDLSHYQYELLYKQGAVNHVPDLLSRPCAAVDITQMDPAKLKEAQMADPLWSEVISYLQEKSLPKKRLPLALSEFELQQDVLYHTRHLPDRTIHQLVVPQSLRAMALKLAHGPPLAAHPGVHRTYLNLRNMFYFPNMLKESRLYVQACETCQRRRGNTQKAPLESLSAAKFPMERVSADITDLGLSTKGFRYVLSIIDHHSRFLQLIPLRNKTSATVTNAFLDHWVTLFGPPRYLLTDNGPEFTAGLFREVCHNLQVDHHFTIAYHPQSNGMIERTNRVVKDALAMLAEKEPRRWPKYLFTVRLGLNSSIHRSTNEQPLFLLLGRHMHFPVTNTNLIEFDNVEASEFQESMRKARDLATETARHAQETWARHYNKASRVAFSPTIGSLVMRRIPPSVRDGPLGSRWAGPCRIVRKLGPVAFLLEDTAPPNTRRRAHINDLKPYVPPLELDFGPDDPEPEDEPVATTSVSKGKTTPWEESLLDAVRVHQPGRPRSKVTTQLGDVAVSFLVGDN